LIELADQLGYQNHSNFTRFFTQHVGVSPSEFRRQTADSLEGTSEP
jgi:AraC family transcriptional regulator